tara:strand:+ start:793 stop:1398 length:606 start_codon:yes stop_codon:yes gene_type:complete
MDKQIIEGVTYVPKAEIEAAFKERIRKLSADRVAAEDRAKELQSELDSISGKLGTIDTMASQLEEYKSRLEEAESRYTRHTAMADHGWTDPELRDAVEWAYTKAMKGKSKKDILSLSDWLTEIKSNPDSAPSILRPHLQGTEQTESAEVPDIDPPALIPPKTNTGIKPTPISTTDILEKAAADPEFYRANRDAIRKAWFNR